MVDANADSVGGKVLTANEKAQRKALIAEINDKGYIGSNRRRIAVWR